MTFFNLFIDHDRTPEEQEWLQEEIDEQEVRYQQIVNEMDALAPTREKWYQDFFDRLQTRGFNADGDERVKIKPEDIPVKPSGRKDQVVWKYGVDEE
jgi:hypothetical protein